MREISLAKPQFVFAGLLVYLHLCLCCSLCFSFHNLKLPVVFLIVSNADCLEDMKAVYQQHCAVCCTTTTSHSQPSSSYSVYLCDYFLFKSGRHYQFTSAFDCLERLILQIAWCISSGLLCLLILVPCCVITTVANACFLCGCHCCWYINSWVHLQDTLRPVLILSVHTVCIHITRLVWVFVCLFILSTVF